MRLSRILGWLVISLACGLPGAMAQQVVPPWGLPSLMHDLAQVRSASARFTERETVQMLKAPLMTSGSLRYVAPDYMCKTTTSPIPENFVLDHDQVTLSGGPDNQTHKFSPNQDPRIGGLVEGIRATLAGDLPALERVYTVRLSGTQANWQLLLQPRDAGLARFVKWIIIQGSQNHLDAVDTTSANGDHSEMGIAEVVSYAQ